MPAAISRLAKYSVTVSAQPGLRRPLGRRGQPLRSSASAPATLGMNPFGVLLLRRRADLLRQRQPGHAAAAVVQRARLPGAHTTRRTDLRPRRVPWPHPGRLAGSPLPQPDGRASWCRAPRPASRSGRSKNSWSRWPTAGCSPGAPTRAPAHRCCRRWTPATILSACRPCGTAWNSSPAAPSAPDLLTPDPGQVLPAAAVLAASATSVILPAGPKHWHAGPCPELGRWMKRQVTARLTDRGAPVALRVNGGLRTAQAPVVPGPFQVAAPAGALLVMTTGTPRGRVYFAAENGSGGAIRRPAGTGPKRVDLPGGVTRTSHGRATSL